MSSSMSFPSSYGDRMREFSSARQSQPIPPAHLPEIVAQQQHGVGTGSDVGGGDPARLRPFEANSNAYLPITHVKGPPPPPSTQHPSSSSSSSSSKRHVDRHQTVKRAKSAQKITRSRKITSCLNCRENKRACDRQRPVCGNCLAGNARGGMCTYVDTPEEAQAVVDNERARKKRSLSVESTEHPLNHHASARPLQLPTQSPLTVRRLKLIAATSSAGRDASLEFEARVRYARAAAVGTILFGTPPTMNNANPSYKPLAAVDSLKLPLASEVGPFLDAYRRSVEWMCNVVLVDLNRSRFENFLNWWHSTPQTLPADPALIPLLLTILALAVQAERKAPGCTLTKGSPSMRFIRSDSPRDSLVDSISSEKELLETAQRCIDVLQILCPSNWASAFSAPLDLVRASLLRGLWHMNELHLQFAGSCFATTVRLAHAAALHHDTRHWPTMGKEEAQARRNIFWNVAMFETIFSMRVVQPSVMNANHIHTGFPDDYEALLNLYRHGGLIEPFITEGRRSHFRDVRPVTKPSFDFHLARFQLTDILIKGQNMAEAYKEWKSRLTDDLQKEEGETHYLQSCMLQMMSLSTSIQIHRPQTELQNVGLSECVDSAQRLIHLIHAMVTRNPGPPFIVFNQCVFHCFQAAIVIAILVTLDESELALHARPSLHTALQTLDMIAAQDSLRYVAEQAARYAAALREVDAKQSAKEEFRPEGDGKILGGQGYPRRAVTPDAATVAPTTTATTAATATAATAADALPPIGFAEFMPQNDFRIFGTADHLTGTFVERPFFAEEPIVSGDDFVTDWGEWERAVERLLYL